MNLLKLKSHLTMSHFCHQESNWCEYLINLDFIPEILSNLVSEFTNNTFLFPLSPEDFCITPQMFLPTRYLSCIASNNAALKQL